MGFFKIAWAAVSTISLAASIIITGSVFIGTSLGNAFVYAFLFIGLFWGLWLAANYLKNTILNYKDKA